MEFFKHWSVYPDIEGVSQEKINEYKDAVALEGKDWKVLPTLYGGNTKTSLAVMGNIAYPINWTLVTQKIDSINNKNNKKFSELVYFITQNKFVIHFKIGDLQFSPSRESLQYTDYTVNNIVNKIKRIVSEIEDEIVKTVLSCKTMWAAKLKLTEFFGSTHDYNGIRNEVRLYSLEYIKKYVLDRLVYNGVNLDGYIFSGAERWDVNGGDLDGDLTVKDPTHKNFLGVVSSVEIRTRRTTKLRVNVANAYNRISIICNSSNVIIHMDTEKKVLVNKAILWYLVTNFKKTANLLTFGNQQVQDDFFKKFSFVAAGAPLLKFSDILAEYKKHKPKSLSKTSGLDGDEIKTRFVNIKNYSYNYRNYTAWSERCEEISLSESGFYIETNDEFIEFNGQKFNESVFFSHIAQINDTKLVDFNLNRVYNFGPKIRDGKKFKKFKKNWTDALVSIKNTLTSLDLKDYAMQLAFHSFIDSDVLKKVHTSNVFKKEFLDNVVHHLNRDNVIVKYRNMIPELNQTKATFAEILIELKINTSEFSKELVEQYRKEFNDAFDAIVNKYEILSVINYDISKYCSSFTSNASFVSDKVVNYVKMIDSSTK